MKFLILQDIPIDQSIEKFCIARGFERAFWRAGFNTNAEDTNILTEQKRKFLFSEFDILIITQNYFLDSINYVNDFKGLKVFWSIDSHKDFERHVKFILDNKIDIVLVSTYNYVNQFKQKRINAYWFPNCYPSDLITPTNFKDKHIQLGFCGSKSNRGEWIDKLKTDCNMHTAINVCGDNMINQIYSYKIGWNRNEADDINFRTFEMMGAGCLLLTNETPGLCYIFGYGCSLIRYTYYNDCVTQIKYFSDHEDERLQISINGYAEVRKNHSYDSRVSDLVKIIETGKGNY